MNDQIRAFLETLDEALLPFAKEGEHFNLFHLGRSSLVMHFGFRLSTSDVDIVGMQNPGLDHKAMELLGKDTPLARSLGLYLDAVPPGVPPLPAGFQKRCEPVSGPWKVLRLWKLEIHDLAVSKLKSFRPQDREDLQALCDRSLLNAATLRARLEKAFQFRSPKPEDEEDDPDTPDWGRALRNLKRVEAYLDGRIRSL